jgi:hypothetical protein
MLGLRVRKGVRGLRRDRRPSHREHGAAESRRGRDRKAANGLREKAPQALARRREREPRPCAVPQRHDPRKDAGREADPAVEKHVIEERQS